MRALRGSNKSFVVSRSAKLVLRKLAERLGAIRAVGVDRLHHRLLGIGESDLALGHGVRAKPSKSGAISFDLVDVEPGHAAVQ